MPNKIEQDIFRVLAYFSYFKYPLTSFEIYKWQFNQETLHGFSEIIDQLEKSDWIKERVSLENGFYCIGQNNDIEEQTKTRHIRFLNATEKYKKLQHVLTYLSHLPFVKGVALCNSLAFHFTEERSDIDLFIITAENKVWTTRLFAVLPMMLLKQRPGEAKKDPVDMSFFVDENSLDISELQLSGDDPYMSFWLTNLTPVYGENDLWQRWFSINNKGSHLVDTRKKCVSRKLRFKFGSSWPIMFKESWSKILQEKKLPQEIIELQNVDTRVVVTNQVLKFHKNDRREEIKTALKNAQVYALDSRADV